MNLGSILGLGCLCRPFPAGFTNLGGVVDWLVVASRGPLDCPRGLSRWTNPDTLGNNCQKAAPKPPFVVLGNPQDRLMKGSMLGAAFWGCSRLGNRTIQYRSLVQHCAPLRRYE